MLNRNPDGGSIPSSNYPVPPGRARSEKPDFNVQLMGQTRVSDRIQESLAIISAISAGELLSSLPAEPGAQNRHQTAVSLLGAIEVLLHDALRELSD